MQPDRPVQTTLAFHASRIVIDVGVLLAMASMSMTFVSAPDGGRSALAADALPAVLLLLPIFVVTLIPDHTRPLHPALGWASMVLALAAVPYAFVKMLDARVLADTLGGSVGIGPVVLLLGCLVTLAGVGVGVVRDLLGKPSGGTPQRSAAYETKRRRPGGREASSTGDGPTRHEPATATSPSPQPSDPGPEPEPLDESEAATRIIPVAAGDGEPQDAEPPRDPEPEPEPEPAQPEIVFPDTGAVAPEPESDDEPDDGLMDTAERADAALTESLMSMWDEDDEPDDDTA